MRADEIIITVSGLHGVGKTVYSEAISEKFGLTTHSSGEFFRRKAEEMGLTLRELSALADKDEKIDLEIDGYAKREGMKGGVVVDGLLTGWMLKDRAHVKIFLKAPLEERVRRIAEREGKSLGEAKLETLDRERLEMERFKRIYGLDLNDLSIYNVVLDTSLLSLEHIKRVLFEIIEGYLKTH